MRWLRIAICGHVDHGKSTLGASLRRELSMVNLQSDLAFINDTLKQERLQSRTMAVSRGTVEIENARITLLDAPGHAEYGPATLSAILAADAVLLVVSAQTGMQSQTRRHLRLIKEFNPLPVLLVLTKVDLNLHGAQELALHTAQELNNLGHQVSGTYFCQNLHQPESESKSLGSLIAALQDLSVPYRESCWQALSSDPLRLEWFFPDSEHVESDCFILQKPESTGRLSSIEALGGTLSDRVLCSATWKGDQLKDSDILLPQSMKSGLRFSQTFVLALFEDGEDACSIWFRGQWIFVPGISMTEEEFALATFVGQNRLLHRLHPLLEIGFVYREQRMIGVARLC